MFINLIIYFTVLSSIFYFIIRNRIDFLLVFFLSTLLYHWQIIGGKIIVPPYSFKASEESIMIVAVVLLIHLVVTIINDKINKERISFEDINVSKKFDQLAYILCLISVVLTLRAIYLVGFDFSLKNEYLSALMEANISPIWLHYPAAMTLVYATASKNKMLFLISLVPLLVYGYMGYRAELIVALVGCITIYAYNSKFNSIRSVIIGLIVVVLFGFFAMYKIYYYEVKDDYSNASYNFEIRSSYYESTSDYLVKIFFHNEWGQVASNLSLSTKNNIGEYYEFPKVLVGSIPLTKRFLDISEDDTRFSSIIRIHANPGFSYGLGSTIWGEAYAALNIYGVIIFSTIVSLVIAYLNNMFYRSNPIFLFSLLFLSFLSFYIHRNDLTLVFAHLKNILFLLLIAGTVYILFNTMKNILLNVKRPIPK